MSRRILQYKALQFVLYLCCLFLVSACFGPTSSEPQPFDRPFSAESDICAANGVEAPCLRIINQSEQTFDELVVHFSYESVAYGTVPGQSTGEYVHVPKGVYRYAAYSFRIDAASFEQGVADFVGEEPIDDGAFTYTINYDPQLQYSPIQLMRVVADDSQRVVTELPTPTPRPAMNAPAASADIVQNTIECFTAQELADAFFLDEKFRQLDGGDAPYVDIDGSIVLHTTAEQFAGDSGQRRFYYDATYESGLMSSASPNYITAIAMLKSRYVNRDCQTDAPSTQLGPAVNSAPFLETNSLDPYLWQNRLLLIFADSAAASTYMGQIRAYAGLSHELIDRNMLWFHLFDIGPDAPNAMELSMGGMFTLYPSYVDEGQQPRAQVPDELAQLLKATYNPDDAEFRVVLIGKDGGVKYDTTDQFGPEQLFPIIDAMPMRQNEMKQSSP